MFNPITELHILEGVNFTPSYSNVVKFASKTVQENSLKAKSKKSFKNVNYIRKGDMVKLECTIDEIWTCNYVMFKNKNRWVYSFILQKEYVSDTVTRLYLKTDVWQTYHLDVTYLDSFVIREHTVPADKSLLDEGFNIGAGYEIYSKQRVYDKAELYMIIIGSVKKPVLIETVEEEADGKRTLYERIMDVGKDELASNIKYIPTQEPIGTLIDGVPYPFCFTTQTPAQTKATLETLSTSQSVIGVVKVEKHPTASTKLINVPYLNKDMETVEMPLSVIDTLFTKQEELSVPGDETLSLPQNKFKNEPFAFKNNSLFNHYPYSYSVLTDYVSNPLEIRHEFLNGLSFGMKFSYGTEPNSRYYIKNYAGDSEGNLYNITNENVLSIPFGQDSYAQYVLQNKNSFNQNITQQQTGALIGGVSAIGSGVASAYTGNVAGVGGSIVAGVQSVNGGINAVKNELAKQSDMASLPPSIKSMGRVGNAVAFGINKVDYITFTVSDDVKQRIGEFWFKYGYKCQRLKKPNLSSQSTFNYVQTSDFNFIGGMESNEAIEFENIFNNGVTIWHTLLNFMDYSTRNEKTGE